jgi:hypothetical protein
MVQSGLTVIRKHCFNAEDAEDAEKSKNKADRIKPATFLFASRFLSSSSASSASSAFKNIETVAVLCG